MKSNLLLAALTASLASFGIASANAPLNTSVKTAAPTADITTVVDSSGYLGLELGHSSLKLDYRDTAAPGLSPKYSQLQLHNTGVASGFEVYHDERNLSGITEYYGNRLEDLGFTKTFIGGANGVETYAFENGKNSVYAVFMNQKNGVLASFTWSRTAVPAIASAD